jgi:hypothetical protein
MKQIAALALLGIATVCMAVAQTATPPMPRDYRGPSTHIDGIFVTPVPNAPFTAQVEIVSHDKLPDGTEHVVKTENTIARASSGRIRNERRQMVPQSFKGEPRLLSAHIYDPNTRTSVYTEAQMRVARQIILPQPQRAPRTQLPPEQQHKDPAVTETSLGNQGP